VVNVKLGIILLRILMALIAFFALVYASGLPGKEELGTFLLNALLVGYSLDSVVDLFGAGMDQRAAAQQATLKTQFAGK
jgi:hypothetical protein